MAKKLTPGTLRAIKAPARGQREHFDKLVAGLALRTSQGGARTWSLLYRDAGGKRRRITIGKAPEVGLAEARTIARDLRAKVRLAATRPMSANAGTTSRRFATHSSFTSSGKASCITAHGGRPN